MHGPVLTAEWCRSACLHPGQDPGRGQGVADVLVDGGPGEDDADDLASGPEQRATRIAGQHVGIERVDAPRSPTRCCRCPSRSP